MPDPVVEEILSNTTSLWGWYYIPILQVRKQRLKAGKLTSAKPHNESVLELRLEPSLATSHLGSSSTVVRELGLHPPVSLPQAFPDSN